MVLPQDPFPDNSCLRRSAFGQHASMRSLLTFEYIGLPTDCQSVVQQVPLIGNSFISACPSSNMPRLGSREAIMAMLFRALLDCLVCNLMRFMPLRQESAHALRSLAALNLQAMALWLRAHFGPPPPTPGADATLLPGGAGVTAGGFVMDNGEVCRFQLCLIIAIFLTFQCPASGCRRRPIATSGGTVMDNGEVSFCPFDLSVPLAAGGFGHAGLTKLVNATTLARRHNYRF